MLTGPVARRSVGRRVQHLVTEQGLDLQTRLLDGQDEQPGLDLARGDGFGDERGVQADQPHFDLRMTTVESLHEVGQVVVRGVAQHPERARAAFQRVDRGDGLDPVGDRAHRQLGVLAQGERRRRSA